MTSVQDDTRKLQRQNMYVRKAITTLLSHKDIKRSAHNELRLACEEALKVLDEQFPLSNGSTPASPSVASVSSFSVLPEPNPILIHVEKFFLPFELACHSKTPKIVCSALDSIEKLVAYGHISYEYFEVISHRFLKISSILKNATRFILCSIRNLLNFKISLVLIDKDYSLKTFSYLL